jgi:hypothetical protein
MARPPRPDPLRVPEGDVTSVAFRLDGTIAAGYKGTSEKGGGVVLFDADPTSWKKKAAQVADHNLSWDEWSRYLHEKA